MTTIIHEELTAMASEFRLSAGNHAAPDDGMCAMELVAFLDGRPHSDHPSCTCEIISAFVRGINDNMPNDARQKLLPFLPRLIGTVCEDREQERHEYFAWQTIRVFVPAALRAQGYGRFARVLQNAETLGTARFTAEILERGVARKEWVETPTPALLAAHHARRASGAAMWFADHQDHFFRGASSITPYTACAEAAASAAFQAYRAGAVDVWDQAFEALDGVLSTCSPRLERGTLASVMD